jgi:cell division septum initiation protein DivIVA
MPAVKAEEPGTIRGVRMTLDDLRDPGFGGRLWGYDREQVDRLLAAVADAVEKLQRRRQRDAAAMEDLARDLADAEARAAEAEQRLAALEVELDAAGSVATEATDRAEAAQRAPANGMGMAASASPVTGPVVSAGAPAPSTDALAALDDLLADQRAAPPHAVPLALRAARALVAEARARAAEIIADAEQRAASSVPGASSRS